MAGIGRHKLEAGCWRIKQSTIWVCLRRHQNPVDNHHQSSFFVLSTESFRFFWITRGCVPLTLIKPQERPTSSLSKSDWSTWKGQGAPAVEPMIHQLSMGWVNIQATVLRPSFHIMSSSQIQICDVYLYIYICV